MIRRSRGSTLAPVAPDRRLDLVDRALDLVVGQIALRALAVGERERRSSCVANSPSASVSVIVVDGSSTRVSGPQRTMIAEMLSPSGPPRLSASRIISRRGLEDRRRT